jgi:outer membrane protein
MQMKKIILAVAVVALAACGKMAKDSNVTETTKREVSNSIAYVRLDSLMSGYGMYNDLNAEFETKAKTAENDVNSRRRALERSLADAQNKVEKGLVTRAEAAQLQEKLARDEQNFMQFQANKQDELAEENQVMMNKILYSVEEFIAEFNSDYRYGMILTTSGAAPVLHADPSMDITAEVLAGLNAKYNKTKQ